MMSSRRQTLGQRTIIEDLFWYQQYDLGFKYHTSVQKKELCHGALHSRQNTSAAFIVH